MQSALGRGRPQESKQKALTCVKVRKGRVCGRGDEPGGHKNGQQSCRQHGALAAETDGANFYFIVVSRRDRYGCTLHSMRGCPSNLGLLAGGRSERAQRAHAPRTTDVIHPSTCYTPQGATPDRPLLHPSSVTRRQSWGSSLVYPLPKALQKEDTEGRCYTLFRSDSALFASRRGAPFDKRKMNLIYACTDIIDFV